MINILVVRCWTNESGGDELKVLQERSGFNGSTRDFTYQTLKDKILNLELEPGTRISEKEVAENLEVSRTPIRESFLKLSQEQLLEIYPQSGTFVSRIDLDHVEEARFVRENIERAVVKLACESFSDEDAFHLETNIGMQELCAGKENYPKLFELDEEFHKRLFFGCGKKRTWHMIQQMNNHFNRLRMLRLSTNLNWDIIISQHKQILDLVKNKEADQAEEAIKQHLRLVVIEKDVLKERYENFFK
jgi:DNA-binding GntR family transcriptional regulator